jgi:Zn-finger nucleic acid-binding protein
MDAVDFHTSPGSVVHVCMPCGSMFVPPRAWSLAFEARDVVAALEVRVAHLATASAASFLSCPTCGQEMDRTRFSATSDVVIDACPAGHGLWLESGELGRAIDYADHKDLVGEAAAIGEADAARERELRAENTKSLSVVVDEEQRLAAKRARPGQASPGQVALGLAVVILLGVLASRWVRTHPEPDPGPPCPPGREHLCHPQHLR